MFSMHAAISLNLSISFLSKTYPFEKCLLTRGRQTRAHRPGLLVTCFWKKKKIIASHTHLFPCCQWVLSHPSVKYLQQRLGSLKYLALY